MDNHQLTTGRSFCVRWKHNERPTGVNSYLLKYEEICH